MSPKESFITLKSIPPEVVLHKLITPIAYVETAIDSQHENKFRLNLALLRHRLILEVFILLTMDVSSEVIREHLGKDDPSVILNLVRERLNLKDIKLEMEENLRLWEGFPMELFFLACEYVCSRASEGRLVAKLSDDGLSFEFMGGELIEVLPQRDFEGAMLSALCETLCYSLTVEKKDNRLKLIIKFSLRDD